MAKKQPSVFEILKRRTPGGKLLSGMTAQERAASSTALARHVTEITQAIKQADEAEADWLESHGLPRDKIVAGQMAWAEFEAYRPRKEFDDVDPGELLDVIRAYDAKQRHAAHIAKEQNGTAPPTPGPTREQNAAILKAIRQLGKTASPQRIKQIAKVNRQVLYVVLHDLENVGKYSGFIRRKTSGQKPPA